MDYSKAILGFLVGGVLGILVAQIIIDVFITPANSATPPNIIVILTDDQDDMGSLDYMPNVKSLMVERGTRFINSFVDTSLCCPSRTTLLTGQSSINHGVQANHWPEGGYYKFAPREDNSLGVWLQRAGYTTGIAGKLLNEYGDQDPTHIVPGWNEFYVNVRPAQSYFGNNMNENGVVVTHRNNEYVTDVISKHAVGFIDRHAPSLNPFFLLITSPAPHDSGAGASPPKPAPRHDGTLADVVFPVPPNFNEEDVSDKPSVIRNLPLLSETAIASAAIKRQKRAEALLAIDEMVRKIVQTLRQNDELDNTIIIFTSDNGFSVGSHRWNKKYLPYEESIRVPLVIRGPRIPKGETRTQLVNNIDLSATILDLAGALPGNQLDGRSLLPLLANSEAPWRSAIGLHGYEPGSAFKGVRTHTMMFAQYLTALGIEEEFYDLATDPYQMVNRISDSSCSAATSFLRQKAIALAACVGESCWIEEEPPSCQ